MIHHISNLIFSIIYKYLENSYTRILYLLTTNRIIRTLPKYSKIMYETCNNSPVTRNSHYSFPFPRAVYLPASCRWGHVRMKTWSSTPLLRELIRHTSGNRQLQWVWFASLQLMAGVAFEVVVCGIFSSFRSIVSTQTNELFSSNQLCQPTFNEVLPPSPLVALSIFGLSDCTCIRTMPSTSHGFRKFSYPRIPFAGSTDDQEACYTSLILEYNRRIRVKFIVLG